MHYGFSIVPVNAFHRAIFVAKLVIISIMSDFASHISHFFYSDNRLKNIIIGVGDEFDSTDTASFDPSSFTQCLNHPGQWLIINNSTFCFP